MSKTDSIPESDCACAWREGQGALAGVLAAHRADQWYCTCGWPLNDSVGSVTDHLAEQIQPLMRCLARDPEGSQCRLFPGHDGQHGDGLGTVWNRAALDPVTPTEAEAAPADGGGTG